MTGDSRTAAELNDGQWWKDAVVYQIYPRSFNDADGDGVGDLRGISEKVDYLADLGVDAVWLTPVYDSPNADYGYDIRDYRSIHDEYGTMADWEALRDRLHERGMKLVMDLVVNHTSDEHEWFQRSRRGEDPYRDYYIWRDGRDGGPPNNWESMFGGPAWTYDDEREAWYLHLFDEKQPDLNWDNPAVRKDVYDVVDFWLEKDVDGFRMDVLNFVSKAEGLPDGDESAAVTGSEHFINGPRVHEYVSELVDLGLDDRDVMTVGEMPGVSVDEARQYVVEDGLEMVFHFEHMDLDTADRDPWEFRDWDLVDLKATVTRWMEGMYPDGWNSIYLGNHDQPRIVSRFGDDDEYRVESAELLATLLFTLRGTPFVYQGDEIGMTNSQFSSVEELQDVETIRYVERMRQRDEVEGFADFADAVRYGSRDNARTPVQWSAEENAGFTTGNPWLDVNPNYETVNVERESAAEGHESVLKYYRRLADLRDAHPVLVYGEYSLLLPDHPAVFAYRRTLGDERAVVVLNFDDGERDVDLSRVDIGGDGSAVESDGSGIATVEGDGDDSGGSTVEDDGALRIANYDAPADWTGRMHLRPYEARVYVFDAD